MANGGIIGPPNPVTPAVCAAANVVSVTATGTYNKTAAAPSTVDLVVVAGGGAGGPEGGGGGAGGLVYIPCFPLAADATPITIGAGGTNPRESGNSPGGDSVFGDGTNPVTAIGGGGGGGSGAPGPARNGLGGGSGGAASRSGSAGSSTQGDISGFPGSGFGNPGGASTAPNGPALGGGGGGAGGSAGPNTNAFGGVGKGSPTIPWMPTCVGDSSFFAGGGGGFSGHSPSGYPGGAGGGGDNPCSPGYSTPRCTTNAQANTGGGGAGAGSTWGYGGSGAVVIQEKAYSIPAKAPGVWSMNTVYEKVKAGNWTN